MGSIGLMCQFIADQWLTPAGLIAFAALAVAVWQGWENRRHYRLRAKPLIDFTYSLVMRGEAPSITIHNKGGGPATIKKITLIAGYKRIDATDTSEFDEGVSSFINEVAKQRHIAPIGNAIVITTLRKDDVLKAGEDRELIVGSDEIAKDDTKNKLLSECMRQLVFEVKVESLYNEKISIRSQGPEKSFFK